MDQISTLYSLQVISDSDSDTEVSSVNTQTDATGLDHENTTSTLHRLQIIWDADNDIENSSLDKQTDATRSYHEQPSTTNADGSTKQTNQGGDESFTENTGQADTSQSTGRDSNLEDGQQNDQQMGRDTDDVEQTQHAKEPSKETKGPGLGFIKILKQYFSPTPSAGNPKMSIKTSTGNTKYYMREVLREYENDKNYEQAFEECKDLLAAKGKLATSVYGISNLGPVVPFKEENVTEEHITYKPNLAQILIDACEKRVKNSTLAWREYIDCIKNHKIAQEVLPVSQSTLDGQGGGEKTPDITQDIKGSDYVDLQNDNLQNTVDGSQQTCPEQAPIDPANTVKADEQPPKENEEEKQTLTLLELLDKDEHKDVDEFEEAHQDFVHMFTCQAVLRSSFPHANVLQHVTVNIDKAEDVPEDVRERALYRYLTNLKPETFDGHYSDIWREYGTLLMAENLLDLARKANGPDQNLYVVVRKTQFYEMQSELQLKTQEVEELSTRLSKFASQQLTEGNPNIADLSDTHRPTRLGEMYSQLFDDEWSEAFEAFKDSTIAKEGDDDEELYPNILSILQTLVTEAFSFCREKSCEQLQELENKIKEALRQNTADTPQTKTADSEEKMEVDQSPPEAGDNKVEKPSQGALDQTVERHSKELRKAASAETVKYQAQIFIKERLPKVLQDDKVRQDQRVISYVLKCVELCWFMNVQDPPMELVAPKEGEDVDKNLFSHHGRKGKKVQTCVWAALLLHKEGPVVCKGYILPKPK